MYSLHATNQPKEKRVKVIVNGDVESIEEFLQIISKRGYRNSDIKITSYNQSRRI